MNAAETYIEPICSSASAHSVDNMSRPTNTMATRRLGADSISTEKVYRMGDLFVRFPVCRPSRAARKCSRDQQVWLRISVLGQDRPLRRGAHRLLREAFNP